MSTIKQKIDKAFADLPLTYKVVKKYKSNCPFCDYPQWLIEVKRIHEWSDGLVEYDVVRLQLHNFIECDDIVSFALAKRTGIELCLFRTLDKLQTNLIKSFNE